MSYGQPQWGPRPGGVPAPRPAPRSSGLPVWLWVLSALSATLGLFLVPFSFEAALVFFLPLIICGAVAIFRHSMAQEKAEQRRVADAQATAHWANTRAENVISRSHDPLVAARHLAAQAGGSLVLGVTPDYRELQAVRPNHGLLILGPPQSGKTTGVIIPGILAYLGAVVSTATKTDVLAATATSRSRFGRIWLFDPIGEEARPPNVEQLRWSPISAARTWDGSLAIARAMVDATVKGRGHDQSAEHFADGAARLLAPLLHAAALHREASIMDVRRWASGDADGALAILSEVAARGGERSRGASLAFDEVRASLMLAPDELSGVRSTTARVLAAYSFESVIDSCHQPNFDADAFVRSTDTVYITAPARHQDLVAPLVVGLLEEIKEAVYRLNRVAPFSRGGRPPLLFALDETANIAPIKNLDRYVSEGGGQGLQVLACFQDLSQARDRWGDSKGKGFLSLFATKLVFAGIGDRDTLDALSTMAGDWDRPYTAVDYTTGQSRSFGPGGGFGTNSGQSVRYSTQRERLLSPSEVSAIPRGHALVVEAYRFGLVSILPAHATAAWRSVTARAPGYVLPPTAPLNLAISTGDALRPISDLIEHWIPQPEAHDERERA